VRANAEIVIQRGLAPATQQVLIPDGRPPRRGELHEPVPGIGRDGRRDRVTRARVTRPSEQAYAIGTAGDGFRRTVRANAEIVIQRGRAPATQSVHRSVTPAEAGVQCCLFRLDSRFRGN